jgi:hypothetical protein
VLAGVVRGVHAAEHQLSSWAGGVVTVQPEGEYGLRDEVLRDHALEGRRNSPYGDLRESQTLHPHNWKASALAVSCGASYGELLASYGDPRRMDISGSPMEIEDMPAPGQC